jgi:UrcA family protein
MQGKDMKRVAISVSIAAVALAVAGVTSAQSVQEVVVNGVNTKVPGAEARSQTVKFADLDLSKSQGVKTLLTRIRSAAGDVCSPQPDAADISGNKDYRKCIGQAVNGAVEKVNSPALTAMASTRSQ